MDGEPRVITFTQVIPMCQLKINLHLTDKALPEPTPNMTETADGYVHIKH